MNEGTPYSVDFYRNEWDQASASAAAMVPQVVAAVRPRSVVDIGCGSGHWLASFIDAGIDDVLGVDGDYVPTDTLRIPRDRFLAHDLRNDLDLGRTFDLAVCLEVAEHLPAARGDDLVAQLIGLAPTVLFSAAVPGQGGRDHVNEQWQEHWRARFRSHGWWAVALTRSDLWYNDKVAPYYLQNSVLYASQPAIDRLDLEHRIVPDAVSLDVVHPRLWLDKIAARQSLRPLLTALPAAASTAVRRRLSRRST